MRPFIHPNQCHTCQIGKQRLIYTAWKRIGRRFAENVTDMRTGCNLNTATALPYAKAHFQIFATPNVHVLIVRANFEEIALVDGEQPAGHCWRIERLCGIVFTQFDLFGAQCEPPKLQIPIEGAPMQFEAFHVRESIIVYDVNDGTHDSFSISIYHRQ